eukprot:gb/GECG01009814.1/.p1 GENE.gb/GECG01009814.1/~~gb/GECG01009814.1/.p1  ORF type:complete len:289 (+),score=63.33 gb/GECG01009814.1/:1-867(+)
MSDSRSKQRITSTDNKQRRDERRKHVDTVFHHLQQKVIDLAQEIRTAHETLVQQLNEADQKAEEEHQRALKAEAEGSKKKKAPDPTKPKRPPTAYLMFCRENRQRVANELGGPVVPKDVTTALAKKWRELSPSDAKPYYERYREAMEEHYAEKQRLQEQYSQNTDDNSQQLGDDNQQTETGSPRADAEDGDTHHQTDENQYQTDEDNHTRPNRNNYHQPTNGLDRNGSDREQDEASGTNKTEDEEAGSENKRNRSEEVNPSQLSTFGPGLEENRKRRKKTKKKKRTQE